MKETTLSIDEAIKRVGVSAELARRFGVKPQAIYNWRSKGFYFEKLANGNWVLITNKTQTGNI